MHRYTVVYVKSLIVFTKTSSVLMIPTGFWQEKMLKALIWFEANFAVHTFLDLRHARGIQRGLLEGVQL